MQGRGPASRTTTMRSSAASGFPARTPVVPELADWAVECRVAAERPTMPLETKLDEPLSTDERDLDTLRARLAEAQRGDADAYDEAWEITRAIRAAARCWTRDAAKKRAETPRQPDVQVRRRA